MNPFPRNVRIGVARAEEAGSTRKVARVAKVGSRRPDEPAREGNESAIAGGISCDKFCRETRALRESKYGNFVARDSGRHRTRDNSP